MAAQRSSPLVCITRAGLTVAVALGLTTVFAERAWLGAALIAAIAPHALIAWTDHRKLPGWVAGVIVVAGAFVFTLYAVEPHTTRHGLPTSATFRQYFHDLGDAPHVLRTAVVPVAPTASALLLALVALWLAGAISEFIARQFDASLGAIAPTLVLFVSIAALGEGGWVWATLTYGAAAALYLVALHSAELTERRSWFHSADNRRSRVLQGGIIGALAIVLAAAVIAPMLPGSRSDPWFDYRTLGHGNGGDLLKATTPIVSIQAKLLQDPEHEVFTVDIGDQKPTYWRVIALDKYDGKLWTLEDSGEPASDLRPPAASAGRTDELVQKFNIRDADPHWLPAAYRPVEVNLEHALVVPSSATMYLKPNSPLTDISYQVTSEVATYTEQEKEASPPVTDGAFARYLATPPGFPVRVERLARAVTATANTPWDKATALATYLNRDGGFVYNDKVARSHSLSTLEDFLFDTKEGYCEQFASAFAAMARSVGLPTRIAVGYSYGTPSSGVWHVKNKDAHAWPEVFFAGLGWIPLEPTPGRGANAPGGTGDASQRPAATAQQSNSGSTTTPTTAPASTPNSSSGPRRPDDPSLALGGSVAGAQQHPNRVAQFFAVVGILALVALVGALLVVAFLVARAVRRSWRRRHADDPRDRVLGAWAEALDHLAEAGVEPKRSATPVEFALRHAPAHGAGDAGPALMDLAHLQTAALYAPAVPSAEEADTAWQKVDAIDRAIAHQMSSLVRWRRRIDPRRLRDEDLSRTPA